MRSQFFIIGLDYLKYGVKAAVLISGGSEVVFQ